MSVNPEDTFNQRPAAELVERAVALLAATPSTENDEDFVKVCVRALAELYRAQFAVAGVFADESHRSIQTLAVWTGDSFGDNFSYHLDGMPCDDILNQRLQLIPDRLAERYPQDVLLKSLGVQSYFGAPLLTASGELLGVLSVMDQRPIELSKQTSPVLNLFAGRLAAELERSAAQASLQHHLTELESAQAATKTSEIRYRELFDHAPIGIWEDDWSEVKPIVDQLSLEGDSLLRYLKTHREFTRRLSPRSKRANAAAVKMYRAPNSYTLCKTTNEAFGNQGEVDNFCQTLAAFANGQYSVTVEGWERTLDGGDIYIRDTVVIPEEFRDNWQRVIHSTEDRTAEWRAEALLSTERKLLRLIARRTSLSEVLDQLCRLSEEQIPNAMCSILLADLAENRLVAGAAPSLPETYAKALDGLQIGDCAGSCGTAAYHRKPVIVADISNDPLWAPFRQLAERFGIKACWSTPVFTQDGEILATLAFSHTRVRSPSDWDLTVMDSANQLARIAIEREAADQALKSSEESLRIANEQIVRSNERLELRVAERTRELEAEKSIIRDNEERFRDLTALSSDWYWEQDAEFRFTVFSGNDVLNTQGLEHILGKTRWELGYTALSASWDEHKTSCEQHQPFRDFEFQVIGEDGWPHSIRISGKPIFNESGEFTGYRGVGQDVTESKRALIALQESETRYRQAAELAHLGYWVWDDIEDRLSDVSELAANIYGFSADEFLVYSSNRANDNELVHPDDRPTYEAALREAETDQSSYDLEFRANTTDGRTRYIREIGEPIVDESGRLVRTIGTLQDITERKLNEAQLLESEERFRNLIEGSIQGILIHRDFEALFVNQAYAAILGFESIGALFDLSSLQTLIAPSDRARVVEVETDRAGGEPAPERYEYEALNQRGEIVLLENLSRSVVWEGKPAIQHTVIDITDRRRLEAERLAHAQRQRDALVREVHHRIKNNLQGVLGLLQDHSRSYPGLDEVLNRASSQIAAVAMVHGLQARSSTEEITLGALVTSIAGPTNRPHDINVACKMAVNVETKVQLSESEAVPVALIINELVANAIKHLGGRDLPDREVRISAHRDGGTTTLTIENPYDQIPTGFDFDRGTGVGTGLELVRSLMPPEGARLRFDTGQHWMTTTLKLEPPVVRVIGDA